MITPSSRRSQWVRVTRKSPCPICGKPDYCVRSANGEVAYCMRVESDHPVRAGGWIHRLSDPLPATPPKPKPPNPPRSWLDECRSMYEHPHAARKREDLAAQLGVSPESLDLLRVGIGWDDYSCQEFSAWPMRNATGDCVGFTRRYDDGAKRTNPGGRNGLFYSARLIITALHAPDDPILIVEGGSDVAACITHGILAVGRPSAAYKTRWMIPLLKRLGHGRPIIVVGERDAKPDRRGTVHQCPVDCPGCSYCWPGLHGMKKVAHELQSACLPVSTLLPPEPYKDIREWLAGNSLSPQDFLEHARTHSCT